MLPFAEEVCLFLQLVLEVNHLDGCHCTFVALVAQASAGTVFGLLHVVGGNQTVNHRDVGCGIQVGDALGSTGAYIVEVRSVATNHTADGNHGIHLSALNHLCGAEGQFKTARYMLDEDILFFGTVSLEGLYGSRQQGYLYSRSASFSDAPPISAPTFAEHAISTAVLRPIILR